MDADALTDDAINIENKEENDDLVWRPKDKKLEQNLVRIRN